MFNLKTTLVSICLFYQKNKLLKKALMEHAGYISFREYYLIITKAAEIMQNFPFFHCLSYALGKVTLWSFQNVILNGNPVPRDQTSIKSCDFRKSTGILESQVIWAAIDIFLFQELKVVSNLFFCSTLNFKKTPYCRILQSFQFLLEKHVKGNPKSSVV